MLAALCAAAFGLSCGPGGGGSAPKKADLFVSSFTHTVNGDIVSYLAEVTNLGNKDALDFLVDIYYDRQVAPVPLVFNSDDFQRVVIVPAGESRIVPFSTFGVAPGTYTSWVQIDAPRHIHIPKY